LEGVVSDRRFWRGKKVLLTGHTGFKGAWLALWLRELGATTAGFALAPDTQPSLFGAAGVERALEHKIGDVRDPAALQGVIRRFRPEIVLHLAAQALVLRARREPVETFATNVMGTAHLLQALRDCPSVRALVVVTSDKCYEPRADRALRESDPLGGHEPYAASKAAAEIVTDAMRRSYFADGPLLVASARAGNVIGGGDWADDRLVPDCVRAFQKGEAVRLRHPEARRPWQHVLEPLAGYLALAERLHAGDRSCAAGWNFAPPQADQCSVGDVVDRLAKLWGESARWERTGGAPAPETPVLMLDAARAQQHLAWRPRLALDPALEWTVAWYRRARAGESAAALCSEQIRRYSELS
jgi:CDP-glucose 4,6-dehydratase